MTSDLQSKETWLDKKLRRRALLKKAAIGTAALGVMYVAPKFTSAGSRPAYASITGGGLAGCTPGFWKTDTPSTDWSITSYTQTDVYESIFTVPTAYATELGGGKTLLTILGQGGGCALALGRHSVAALLNASITPGTTIGISAATVISGTNAALTGDCAVVTAQKDYLAGLNETGCGEGARITTDP